MGDFWVTAGIQGYSPQTRWPNNACICKTASSWNGKKKDDINEHLYRSLEGGISEATDCEHGFSSVLRIRITLMQMRIQIIPFTFIWILFATLMRIRIQLITLLPIGIHLITLLRIQIPPFNLMRIGIHNTDLAGFVFLRRQPAKWFNLNWISAVRASAAAPCTVTPLASVFYYHSLCILS